MKVDRIKAVKIGIFDPYLDTLGGGERYILTIASCLIDKHEVFLLWNDTSILKKAYMRFNINLDKLKLSKNIFNASENILGRRRETKKYDVIIYVSDGSIPFLFARKNILLFQFPVNWVNGNQFLSRIKLGRIDKTICYSSFVKKHLDKTFKINSVVLSPNIDSVRMMGVKKENIILSVGRFTKAINTKKQEVLIKVFKENYKKIFSDWKLVIVGSVLEQDTKYLIDLKKTVGNYPIEIYDNASYAQLTNYYQMAKIYWHASGFGEDLQKHPERAEHFGISTVEAMGAGAVPVVINAGGQKEIISDGESGFLWNSLDDLIEKTQLLINDEKLWLQMSQQAVRRAKDFAGNRFCEELYKILDL